MVPIIKKKRYLLAVLLAVILTVVLFLPLIFSSDTVLRIVVSRINGTVPGHLSISSWLIDWQQGLLCQDIVYKDDQKGIRVTIPRLTSTQGLLELVFAPKDLGLVGIDSPVVELSGAMFSEKGSSGGGRPSSSAGGNSAAWDKLTMQFQVRDGMIKAGMGDAGVELGIKNIDLHSSLAEGVVDFSLKLQAMGEQGVVEVEGSLNLPARSKDLLETLIVNADVTVHNYQFRDYLSFIAPLSNFPTGEGILNADFNVKVVGIEEVGFSGTAGLTDLKLAGGMLREDTPVFQEISLSLEDADWSRLYWTAKQLNLETDAGTLYFSGERKDKKLQVKSRGTLSIPVLFDQFPHLLRVQEATLIESGSLDFTADLSVDGLRGEIDVKAHTENLGGLFDGKPFTWDNPLTVILHGEKEGIDFRIRRLQVDAPFAQAFGQGNLQSFDLEASADVGATLIEVGKLFQHPWSGTGKLELEAKASGSGAGDKNYTVETDLNISSFSLSRSDTVIIPRHDFSVVGSAQAPFSLLKGKTGMFDLQFAFSSWIGEVFLALNGERGNKDLFSSRYSTDTNLNLDTLSAFLHTLDRLPWETKMTGDLQVQATGFIDRSTLEIDELNSSIQDFSFSHDEVALQDKKIILQIDQSVNDKVPSLAIHELVVSGNRDHYFSDGAGVNSVRFPEHSVFLHNISVKTGFGELQLDELIIQDWLEPLINFDTKFLVNGDLEKLTPLLHDFDILKPETNLSGTGQLIFHALEKNVAGQDIQADLQLDDFFLSRQKRDLLKNEKIELITNLTGKVATGDFIIREIRLNSGPLDMKAIGTLKPMKNGRVLELKGEMTPKMDRVASIINNTFDLGVAMQGQQVGPFEVKYHLGGNGEKEKNTDRFVTTLFMDKVEYKGVDFAELKFPVSLQDNNLHAELAGRMNDGVLNLVTDITFNLDSPVMHMPPAGQIMTGVQLNKPVVDGVLDGVHPLFGVLATPTGRVDVVVDSLTWPLEKGGEQEADFVVIINSREVNFESTGFMQGILGSFGLNKEELTLKDSKIHCVGHGGRIACSPIRILAGGSEMVLSGSVGMDKSLDYLLQVPITEKLVGREGYRVLEGTTIRVPIRGTSGKPDFDRKMVTAAVEDLAKQAAVRTIEKKAVEILPGLIEGILGSPGQQ